MDSHKLTALRLQLLNNGYIPLPNVDKVCRLKDWPRVEVTPELVPTWAPERALRAPQATGLRIERGLVAIDVDISDPSLASEARFLIGAIAPQVFELERIGSPVKTLFLCRRADLGASGFQAQSGKWAAFDGSHARIEIFANDGGKQIGAFGPHSHDENGRVLREYQWKGESPLTVKFAALPVVSDSDLRRIYGEFDRLAGGLKLARVEAHASTEGWASVYDLTEETDFDGTIGVTALAQAYLAAVHGGQDLRVSSSFTGVPAHNATKCQVGWAGEGYVVVNDYEECLIHRPADRDPQTTMAPMAQILAFARPQASDEPLEPEPVERLPDHHEVTVAGYYRSWVKDLVRYDHDAKAFYRFDGATWQRQDRGEVKGEIIARCAALAEGADERDRARLKSDRYVTSVVNLLKSVSGVGVSEKDWDNDPMLLGTPGGTVDLRTGRLRPAKPEDMIRRATSCAPADEADCPKWKKFLNEVMVKDPDKVKFIQQYAGLTLVGHASEVFAFLHGSGRNGKGVLLTALFAIMGSYAVKADDELFVKTRGGQHKTTLKAIANGPRMVWASETNKDAVWHEARIKDITGRDPTSARGMRENDQNFRPSCTIWMASNHKPQLESFDHSMRARLMLVPFLFKAPEEVKDGKVEHYGERLVDEEGPEILRWMLEGLADWQKNGLAVPASMKAAAASYFDAEDHVKAFAEEAIVAEPKGLVSKADMFARWREFAVSRNVDAGKPGELHDRLVGLGLKYDRARLEDGSRPWGWLNVKLLKRTIGAFG